MIELDYEAYGKPVKLFRIYRILPRADTAHVHLFSDIL